MVATVRGLIYRYDKDNNYLVDADASNNSVIDTRALKVQLQERFKKLEARLEESGESADPPRRYDKKNRRYISTTDPDGAIVNRGTPKLSYQVPGLRGYSAKCTERLRIFSEEVFEYDPESDTYRFPAGNRLKPKSLHFHRKSREYAAPKKICAA